MPLFELLREATAQPGAALRCDQSMLLRLARTLEDVVLARQIPALICAGVPDPGHWGDDGERYRGLAQVAQQLYVFSPTEALPAGPAPAAHIALGGDDRLSHEWFLVIRSAPYAVALCGRDNHVPAAANGSRQFDVLWSFEPEVIDRALQLLERVVAGRRPELLPGLEAARADGSPIHLDPSIVTSLTMEMARPEDASLPVAPAAADLPHEEFARLYEATRDLAARPALPELHRAIVERARWLSAAAGGALFVPQAPRRDLKLVASQKPGYPFDAAAAVEAEVASQVAQARRLLTAGDDRSWPHGAAQIEAADAAAVAGVPLLFEEELLGVLVLQKAAATFAEADARLLTRFAEQAASALAAAHRLDEARRRLSELELVTDLSARLRAARAPDELLPVLLDETLSALDLTAGSIWLYDPAHDEVVRVVAHGFHTEIPVRLKPYTGVAGLVFVTGQPYHSREFKSDPYAHDSVRTQVPPGWGGVCAPLRVGQEVIGALFVTAQLPRELTAGEARLVSTLADLAGSAILGTRQTDGPQRRVQRLAALRTIDSVITASLDLQVTLNVILDQVTARLGVNAAAVLLLDAATQTLEYAAGRGFHTDGIARSRLRLGEDYAGRAALKRHSFSISDLSEADDSFVRAPLLEGEGFVVYHGVPLIAKGQVKGVLEIFHRAPLSPDPEWLDFLEALAAQAAIAIDNAALFADLQRSNVELALAYDTTLEGWSRALDLRDRETEGHTRRVTELTVHLAQEMGMSEAELVHLRRGALLHDIGKMGIPDSILLKPGPLTGEEWAIMRRHPEYAYDMLSPIAYLHPALDIPYCHHERWNGTGYPRGLSGGQIPQAARIFAVIDVWDALRSNRPYRPAWTDDRVRDYIRSLAGTHFEPDVVAAFIETEAWAGPGSPSRP